jgi:hypothetical protein
MFSIFLRPLVCFVVLSRSRNFFSIFLRKYFKYHYIDPLVNVFCGHLYIYGSPGIFFRFGMLYKEKSGNPARAVDSFLTAAKNVTGRLLDKH